MKSQFMFSGIGGQGVISIGELICTAAAKHGYTVTFVPSYGQEKRGGRTMCQIVISEKMGSPIISFADLLMVMDERSLADYEDKIKKDGILLINSNLVHVEPKRKDIKVFHIPFNDMAKEVGNAKTSNMVALGAALKYLQAVSLDEIKGYLQDIFPGKKAKLIPVNEAALDAGFNYTKE